MVISRQHTGDFGRAPIQSFVRLIYQLSRGSLESSREYHLFPSFFLSWNTANDGKGNIIANLGHGSRVLALCYSLYFFYCTCLYFDYSPVYLWEVQRRYWPLAHIGQDRTQYIFQLCPVALQ